MNFRRAVTRGMAIAVLTACSPQPSNTATQPPETAPAAAPAASAPASASAQPLPPPTPVAAWFDCVECDVERKSLIAVGDAALPELRTVLLNGPSQERLAQNQQKLKTSYAALKRYEQTHPDRSVSTEQAYLQRYQDKYILLHRSRAALGLGAIGSAQARTVLREALKMGLPEELRLEVERALKTEP